jgi:hypothetical protein
LDKIFVVTTLVELVLQTFFLYFHISRFYNAKNRI